MSRLWSKLGLGGVVMTRRILLVALAAYTAFVLFVTLTPRIPGTGTVAILVNSVLGYFHDRGLLIGVGYDDVEFLANIGMFVPLGVLAMLVWRAWWVLLLGTALSGFVELYQSLLLPGRVGEWRDVLSNSIGFLLGAGIVLLVRALRPRRNQDGPSTVIIQGRGDYTNEE